MDVEAANEAAESGKLASTIEDLVKELKPEASYFCPEQGKRTAYLIFDLKESSDIVKIAEPLFATFKAEIDIKPVMNLDDLKKGLSFSQKPSSKSKSQSMGTNVTHS